MALRRGYREGFSRDGVHGAICSYLASITWQCSTLLWGSSSTHSSKWISPCTSSLGSTRVRLIQLSMPTMVEKIGSVPSGPPHLRVLGARRAYHSMEFEWC